MRKKCIAVDLDGTLAHYDHWRGIKHIGEPIQPMVDQVNDWLGHGHEVWIFTARLASEDDRIEVTRRIVDWCHRVFGCSLPMTWQKFAHFDEFWDDRAVAVETNTGRVLGGPGKPFREGT